MTSDTLTRDCKKCGESKPLDKRFFFVSGRKYKGRTYFHHTCRTCYGDPGRYLTPERAAYWKRQHRVFRWRKDGINITLEQHDALHDAQKGVCAICGGRDKSGRALHVDHDHATGVIRGLLCTKCNTGLGCFRDDTERMEKASQYLERYQ